jgi:hypothetical protein
MKKSPLSSVLIVMLALSALASVAMFYMYNRHARELRSLQRVTNDIAVRQQILNALAAESLEYSKKNPAIDPILEAAGVKPGKTAAPTTNKPATK